MKRLEVNAVAECRAGVRPAAWAETAEEKGLAIAEEADRRDSGWGDQEAEMVMTLRNRQGEESVREVRVRNMEVDGDGDKGLSIFDRPRDVKGTAVLTWSHSLEPDDQWIFLPALKRVKRINSKNKSGPFMGSEFAYEDISSQEVDKYRHVYLRDEPCGEDDKLQCFVVERQPQYEFSGYTKQEVWIDQEHYRAQKIVYYDRKGAKLKTLTMGDYHQYLDQYWRAHRMQMNNHQTGKSTELLWQNFRFDNGFTDRDFDKNTLKRVR